MILTTPTELSLYLPSHMMRNSIESIQGFIQSSEESLLRPLLGRPLYDALTQKYTEAYAHHPEKLSPATRKDADDWAQLIFHAQRVVVFNALLRGADILAVNINEAGINISTAEQYAEAPDKAIERFKAQANKEAHQGIDQLLLFLEHDASAPDGGRQTFTTLWQQSKYYTLVAGRLVNTADVFSRYVNIYDSREKFVALMPDIAYCERMMVRPDIGHALVSGIIARRNSGTLTDTDSEALELLQTALCMFVEQRNSMFTRKEAGSEAIAALAEARQYIADHLSEFPEEEVKTSPLRTPDAEEDTAANPKKELVDSTNRERTVLNENQSAFIFPDVYGK